MSTLAVDLKLPFNTEHLISSVKRECNLNSLQQWRISKEDVDPVVIDFLADVGITISHAEGFLTPAKQLLPIHVDGPEINNIAKLNWQWQAQGSWMLWWKLKRNAEAKLHTTGIGTRYLKAEAADCIPIYRHQIKTPTLVNVGTPHSVINTTAEPRWVLSLVLWDIDDDRALKFDEAHERLTRFCY